MAMQQGGLRALHVMRRVVMATMSVDTDFQIHALQSSSKVYDLSGCNFITERSN